MQKIRLSKLVIIGLAILVVTSVSVVYAFAFQDDWVVVATKSATVKAVSYTHLTLPTTPYV